VFLFVICGGSLIYGFVQQRRIVESKVQMEKFQQKTDSLKMELEKSKAELKATLEELLKAEQHLKAEQQ